MGLPKTAGLLYINSHSGNFAGGIAAHGVKYICYDDLEGGEVRTLSFAILIFVLIFLFAFMFAVLGKGDYSPSGSGELPSLTQTLA